MRLTPDDFALRIERTRTRMAAEGLDALFIFSDEYRPGHAMYFTGFQTINMIEESSHAIWLPLEGDLRAFTGPLNTFAARRDSYVGDVRPIPGLEQEIRQLVADSARPIRRVGLVGENLLPLATWRMLSAGLGPDVETVDAVDLVIGERQVKTPIEMELLEEAGRIGDISLRAAIRAAVVGSTENELVAIGEHASRLAGGSIGCAYLAVVGENTDLPTWRPTDRAIKPGELVMLDFAPAVEGYASDVAVTIPMEGATQEQRDAVTFAWLASAKFMEWMVPGIPAKDVFFKVLDMVTEAGYRDYFLPYTRGTRAIGHGVGLDVVEPPDFGPNSDWLIEPGMVLAAKFDLHGWAWGGLRVEHVVAITEAGPKALNCPLSDACPAKDVCAFYQPGGGAIDLPWSNLRDAEEYRGAAAVAGD
ncbi:MAG: aminopeptidase family protein [Modestobacter sp.]|nr:aminopeptidase family protein [Modestobacter sp.]